MVVKLKANLALVDLDIKDFTKRLKRKLDVEHRSAVRAWLVAALSKIPTYTGTTRGLFKPIGRMVNYVFSISPKSGHDKYFFIYPKGGIRYPLGVNEADRYTKSDMDKRETPGQIEYYFIFENELLYAVWNETRSAPGWLNLKSTTPWNALVRGAEAFEEYVTTEIPKHLPDHNMSVRVTHIKVR
jgi:hypothetical protein